jgi:hypothetical protein
MPPASPPDAATLSPDALEAACAFEFAETLDAAATAPAPALKKSRRVVFIFSPPIPHIARKPGWHLCQDLANPLGLVNLITVSDWNMKRLHDGAVDRVEESRHFGLGSSFNSIDCDEWHGVILLSVFYPGFDFCTSRMSRPRRRQTESCARVTIISPA